MATTVSNIDQRCCGIQCIEVDVCL